jgi:hypothetical protein|tara:strand:+ start:94 stop:567 length:474 start_codon:yes stop_codon:yes gene_type:complete
MPEYKSSDPVLPSYITSPSQKKLVVPFEEEHYNFIAQVLHDRLNYNRFHGGEPGVDNEICQTAFDLKLHFFVNWKELNDDNYGYPGLDWMDSIGCGKNDWGRWSFKHDVDPHYNWDDDDMPKVKKLIERGDHLGASKQLRYIAPSIYSALQDVLPED